MQNQGSQYPYSQVIRSNVTADACAPVVNFKGGLDTLNDPECNFGSHTGWGRHQCTVFLLFFFNTKMFIVISPGIIVNG